MSITLGNWHASTSLSAFRLTGGPGAGRMTFYVGVILNRRQYFLSRWATDRTSADRPVRFLYRGPVMAWYVGASDIGR